MPDNTSPVSQQGLPLGMAFRWVLAITLLLGGVLSAIIPPGKSPDEADHMVRAYLLSQGHVFLKTKPGARPRRGHARRQRPPRQGQGGCTGGVVRLLPSEMPITELSAKAEK